MKLKWVGIKNILNIKKRIFELRKKIQIRLFN